MTAPDRPDPDRSGRTQHPAGRAGEKIARKHLEKLGYTILATNWRPADTTVRNEIDLVARDGDTVVFVEVKTAGTAQFGDPASWITPRKRERIIRAAEMFIAERATPTQTELFGLPRNAISYRFDAVAVTLHGKGPPKCRHVKSAFVADGWVP